jgi:hypothetical protein
MEGNEGGFLNHEINERHEKGGKGADWKFEILNFRPEF